MNKIKKKKKRNKTFLILQCSTLKSTVVPTSYITAAFTLASGHPGLEIKILYYCTLYSTDVVGHVNARSHL